MNNDKFEGMVIIDDPHAHLSPVERIRKKKAMAAWYRKIRRKAIPAPRYDEIYAQGSSWLDNL